MNQSDGVRDVAALGEIKLPTIRKSRRPVFSRFFAIVGGGLGVYLTFAIAFNWFTQPKTSVQNIAVATPKPLPASVAVVTPKPPPAPVAVVEAPVVPPAPSVSEPPIAVEPPASQAFAAAPPEAEEKPARVVAKPAPRKHAERTTPRQEAIVRDRRNSGDHASHSPYEFRSSW